jgi:menaquinone-9 beta-reductase
MQRREGPALPPGAGPQDAGNRDPAMEPTINRDHTQQDSRYDLAVVGGGLAGAGLATVMARAGQRVLLVERTTVFRDRVRGEWLAPWGVEEARRAGLYEAFESAGAHAVPWNVGRNGEPRLQASPSGELPVGFSHPAAQSAMLAAARAAGVAVMRGAVARILPGDPPRLRIRAGVGRIEVSARMIVGADGRGSIARAALGRPQHEHRSERLLAGVRVAGLAGPDDTGYYLIRPDATGLAMIFPQGGGYGRIYVILAGDDGKRFTGPDGFAAFLDAAMESGVPYDVLEHVTQSGPLASFVTSDSWVEQPYEDGIALIGDAAGISDPTWGMGMSLALRDVRVLSEYLRSTDDWDAAGRRYAQEHDRYFDAIRRVENWQSELLLTPGEATAERRRHAARLWSQDPSRLPDIIGLGPEVDASERARMRFFGEDVRTAAAAAPATTPLAVPARVPALTPA